MTKPIVLYDENHERVGETYPRRAKQLIKSGRAAWLEDGQSLLINTHYEPFPPVKEELFTMTETIYQNNGHAMEAESPAAPPMEESNELLLYLAKKNVAEKKSLFRHVIAYILAWPVLHIAFRLFREGYRGNLSSFTSHRVVEFVPHGEWFTDNIFTFHSANPHVVEGSEAVSQIIAHHFDPVAQVFYQAAYRPDLLWHFALGMLAAWGIWIAVRGIKVLRRHMHTMAPRLPKPDPVALEYQRLMSSQAV